MSDSDVYLVDGNWANPNCITVHGKPVHPDEVTEENSNDARAKRAEFVEFHSLPTQTRQVKLASSPKK